MRRLMLILGLVLGALLGVRMVQAGGPGGSPDKDGHPGGVAPAGRPQDLPCLALDDGSGETGIGFGFQLQNISVPAIWLNRFTPPAAAYPIHLHQISIQFPSPGHAGQDLTGFAIDLLVYQDADGDGDPSNADKLLQITTTIAVADGVTFSHYPVDLTITGGGDVYIGFSDTYNSGQRAPYTKPAPLDTGPSQRRSWVAAMTNGNNPDYDNLARDDFRDLIDDVATPGNWVIRANDDGGCPASTPTPTASATVTPGASPTVTPDASSTALPGGSPTPSPGASPTPLPGASPTPCAIRFADVNPTDYFYTPVIYLTCHGIISGYADGTFRPYNQTTRGQMVKIVTLGFGLPNYTPPTGYTFADVLPAHPFWLVVEAAAHAGVVGGYTCGTAPAGACDAQQRPYFLAYADVTRGQLAKIVALAAHLPLQPPPSPTFADVPTGSAFYPFVEAAAAAGLVSGYACGAQPAEPCTLAHQPYFRPAAPATRGQIAKIVYAAVSRQSPVTSDQWSVISDQWSMIAVTPGRDWGPRTAGRIVPSVQADGRPPAPQARFQPPARARPPAPLQISRPTTKAAGASPRRLLLLFVSADHSSLITDHRPLTTDD